MLSISFLGRSGALGSPGLGPDLRDGHQRGPVRLDRGHGRIIRGERASLGRNRGSRAAD
jgi:hypothetical protein